MRVFDTGVLLKLYLPEPRATEAIQLVNGSGNKPPFTKLHALEMRSALRQKAGRGEISATECQKLLMSMENDLAAGVFEVRAVSWPDVFDRAETLSAAHGVATLCRRFETLHVALAVEQHATEFYTFDHRQSLMATAAGLRIVP